MRLRGRSPTSIGSPQTTAQSRRFVGDQPNVSSPHGITGTPSCIAIISPPGCIWPGMAEALARALEVHADELALARELARVPERVAVALAAPDAEDAERSETRTDHGHPNSSALARK